MACSAPAGYVHAVRVGAAGRAAIPRVANLTGAEFAAYDGQLPVIVERGYDAPCLAWTWEKLLAAHGETRFAATAATGKDRQGLAFELAALDTMRKHVTPDQWMYVMDETVTQRVPDLLRDCPPPPLLAAEDFFPLLPAEVQSFPAFFLLGTEHSESSIHVDPFNWTGSNLVLFGRKEWVLVPPGAHDQEFRPARTTSGLPLPSFKYQETSRLSFWSKEGRKVLQRLRKKAPVYEGSIGPGEYLVIPSGWWHQARNTELTLAIAGQTCNAANFRSVIKETVRFHEHENRGRAWPAFEDRGVFATPGPVPPATAEAVFRAFAASIPQDVLAKGQRQLQDEISQVEQTKKERGRKKKK